MEEEQEAKRVRERLYSMACLMRTVAEPESRLDWELCQQLLLAADYLDRLTGLQSEPGPVTSTLGAERRPRFGSRRTLRIYKRDGYHCLACGSTDDLTLDHIVPWPEGGNDDGNLQVLCSRCNVRKGRKTIDYRGGVA